MMACCRFRYRRLAPRVPRHSALGTEVVEDVAIEEGGLADGAVADEDDLGLQAGDVIHGHAEHPSSGTPATGSLPELP